MDSRDHSCDWGETSRSAQGLGAPWTESEGNAAIFRPRAANLPPHISSLYALTRKPFAEFSRAIEKDLRAMTRTEIAQLFAPAPRGTNLRLMTISLPAAVADETRREVMVDIRNALTRIAEYHAIDITASTVKLPFRHVRPRHAQAPGSA